YLKEKQKTDESFLPDGWFMTGDISQFNADGTISIIDRKKNIFKLSQGEYVAPEKIENILSKHHLIMQSFVHGDSFRDKLVAVIVPDPASFLPWASNLLGHPSPAPTLQELCHNSIINAKFLKIVQDAGRAAKLAGFEIPRAVYLEPHEFDIDSNELLTPTLKLKRSEATKYYANTIQSLYKSLESH
ncbi:Long-chain-fatty-acid-CoA ligase 5, partial [Smittium mucronatum]